MSMVAEKARLQASRPKGSGRRHVRLKTSVSHASAPKRYAIRGSFPEELSDRSGLTILEQRAFEYMDAKLRELTRDEQTEMAGLAKE